MYLIDNLEGILWIFLPVITPWRKGNQDKTKVRQFIKKCSVLNSDLILTPDSLPCDFLKNGGGPIFNSHTGSMWKIENSERQDKQQQQQQNIAESLLTPRL